LILALTNYQVVAAKFLELAAVVVLTELLATEEKTSERKKLLQGDRTWLRVHELWLLEIRANLVRH
jgi:hypothetical protein